MSSYPNLPTDEGPKRKWIVVSLLLLLILVAGVYVFSRRGEGLANMSAAEAHLAIGPGTAEPVQEIERSTNPEVYYHIVLHGAPMGWSLELHCEWLDPAGSVARNNVYETRFIYKSTWPTHCRQAFSSEAAAGPWQVRLLSGERVVSSTPFVLK